MKGTILSYSPNTNAPDVWEIDGPVELDVLKEAIGGGYLEAVPYFKTVQHGGSEHECVAFCDEDGKAKGLPVNIPATQLWDRAMQARFGCTATPDFLVGQIAVVFGDAEFMDTL